MKTERRSPRAIAICVAATLGLIAADLASKEWASDTLSAERTGEPPPLCGGRGTQRRVLGHCPDGSVCHADAPFCGRGEQCALGEVLIADYLEFQYAENCGAAFGLLRDADDWVRRAVFGVAALGAVVALMWMFVVGRGGPLFAWSVPFVVSGAVGNLVDRVRYGYVVDFIRFHIYDKFEWPTFNVADITIVIGVGLLVLDGMRKDQGKQAPVEPAGDAEAGGPSTTKRKRPSGGKKKKPARGADAER